MRASKEEPTPFAENWVAKMNANIAELIRTKQTVTIQMTAGAKEPSHTGIIIADLGTLLHLQGKDGHGWYIPREKIAEIRSEADRA